MSDNATASAESAVSQDVGTPLSDRCGACNRRLKDPESMRVGMGPVCRKRHAAQVSAQVQQDGERED